MTKVTFIFFGSILLVTLLSTVMAQGTSSSCGSAVIRGPLDEQGNPPNSHKMLTLQATSHNHVNVTCQLNIASGDFNGYNPRLRIYFTCDAQVCVLLSKNGSHAGLTNLEQCEGITYTYHKNINGSVMNFKYEIPWIDRLQNSVINCGVNYHPPDATPDTLCFKDTAGSVTFQENQTCSIQNPTTETPTSSSTTDRTTTDESTTNTSKTATTSTVTETLTTRVSTINVSTTKESQDPSSQEPSTTMDVDVGGQSRNESNTLCVEINTVIFIATAEATVIVVLLLVVILILIVKKKVSPGSRFTCTVTERNLDNSMTIIEN